MVKNRHAMSTKILALQAFPIAHLSLLPTPPRATAERLKPATASDRLLRFDTYASFCNGRFCNSRSRKLSPRGKRSDSDRHHRLESSTSTDRPHDRQTSHASAGFSRFSPRTTDKGEEPQRCIRPSPGPFADPIDRSRPGPPPSVPWRRPTAFKQVPCRQS